MIRWLVARVRAWWDAPLPDVDSHPTLSRLDLLDRRNDIHWDGDPVVTEYRVELTGVEARAWVNRDGSLTVLWRDPVAPEPWQADS